MPRFRIAKLVAGLVTGSLTGSPIGLRTGSVAGLIVCFCCCLGLVACSSVAERPVTGPSEQMQILSAQQQRAHNMEVTVTATVRKMLPDDTEGLPHQRFLLELANGSTVLVAHNTGEAPRVPIEAGELVTVHGEFIWNKKGGVLHWTHHCDNGSHEGGYIDYQGKRYQ